MSTINEVVQEQLHDLGALQPTDTRHVRRKLKLSEFFYEAEQLKRKQIIEQIQGAYHNNHNGYCAVGLITEYANKNNINVLHLWREYNRFTAKYPKMIHLVKMNDTKNMSFGQIGEFFDFLGF